MSRSGRTSSRGMESGESMLEALEPRRLLSVSIEFDYSLDTNNFFESQERRDLLETVADDLAERLEDDLAAIMPLGFNTWEAKLVHPGTGDPDFGIEDLEVPEDTLLIFAGARPLDDSLARGGAGGFSASGTQEWLDTVRGRGQPGALGDNPTDFAPWGGTITFDTGTNWHFGETTDGLDSNEADFISTALHELFHVLGFSFSNDSFARFVDEGDQVFTGPATLAEWDEPGFPRLASDLAHWEEGLLDNGVETALDPTLGLGNRKLGTPLDFASLEDIGWELTDQPAFPGQGTLVPLAQLTGDGEMTSSFVSGGADTQVFSFDSLAVGPAFVQVVTEQGSDLDARVRVFDEAGLFILEEGVGTFGNTADTEFLVDGTGERYTLQVERTSGSGDFTLRLDTEPVTHFLFYPEGFANDRISEFVSITNPNDFEVTYTVRLKYEDPALPKEALIQENVTLAAGARGGVTIATREEGTPGEDNFKPATRVTDLLTGEPIEKATPYAIVIESDAPLAATISHFDFGIATGESFTDVTSDVWSFARATRTPGEVFSFPIFYNPNDHDARVSVTLMPADGSPPVTLSQQVEAGRRSGFNLNAETTLPEGQFGVIITSEAFDPSDQDDHIGIVAAITEFDDAEEQGWSVVGTPELGAPEGVIPSLALTEAGRVEVTVFNPSTTTAALVTITASFINSDKTDVVLPVQNIGATGSLTLTGETFGMEQGDEISIQFSTATGGAFIGSVVVQGLDVRFADSASITAPTEVGTGFFFGDAFINANLAGELYFETLSFFNPNDFDIQVDIEFRFSDGVQNGLTVTVPSEDFFNVDLHTLDQILNHKNLNFFGIITDSDEAFAVTMTHFDLFFGSGWGATGAPLGLTVPIAMLDGGIGS